MQEAFEGLGRRLVQAAWMAVAEHLRQSAAADDTTVIAPQWRDRIGGADPFSPSNISAPRTTLGAQGRTSRPRDAEGLA